MSDIKIHCLYDELVDPRTLKNHKDNRNKHPPEQIERLAKILDYQGWRYAIKVSKQTKSITSGHGRKLAALDRGWKLVPVVYQDYESEEQEYADVQADNAIALWAELDLPGINSDIGLLGPDFDIDLLGIKNFTVDVADKEFEADEDEVPEARPDPKVVRGEVYILGNHRLMCGDSTAITDVERLMNGDKADMVFTDPPYNVASDSVNFASNVSKSMNDLKNSEWDKGFEIEPPVLNAITASKDSATFYVWTSHYLFNRIIEAIKPFCDFTGYLVWSKPNPMPSLSKRHPTWNTELCVYGTRGSKRIVNFPSNEHFLSCRTVTKKSDGSHPTQKPLELIEPLIEFSSGKNQLILDLFGGSGSTLIACEKTARNCFMMELDPLYCGVILDRWQKFTGKKAHREDGIAWDEIKGGE